MTSAPQSDELQAKLMAEVDGNDSLLSSLHTMLQSSEDNPDNIECLWQYWFSNSDNLEKPGLFIEMMQLARTNNLYRNVYVNEHATADYAIRKRAWLDHCYTYPAFAGKHYSKRPGLGYMLSERIEHDETVDTECVVEAMSALTELAFTLGIASAIWANFIDKRLDVLTRGIPDKMQFWLDRLKWLTEDPSGPVMLYHANKTGATIGNTMDEFFQIVNEMSDEFL